MTRRRSVAGGVALALCALVAVGGCGGDDEVETREAAPPALRAVRTLPEPAGGSETRPTPERAPAIPLPPERKAPPTFRLERLAPEFDSPVYVAAPRSEPERLYVVERAGKILVLENGELRQEPFLDISARVRTEIEEGLHSIAFHPRYEQDPRVYVAFNDKRGDVRVVEYRSDGDRADPARARELLAIDKPEGVKWHNGGQLQFGPDDRLYLSMGDAARNHLDPLPDHPDTADPNNNAQNLSLLYGKLLRLDVDARQPKPEVAAYGLRNTWRFSFDRANGDLYLADVGQFSWEEIDYLPAGTSGLVNFGWSVFEAGVPYNGEHALRALGELVWPIARYQHSPAIYCSGRGSIIGGYVYRGAAIPALAGRYVFGDYCTGEVWSLRVIRGRATDLRLEPVEVPELSSFGEDAAGELYATSIGDSAVYRLVPRS